MRFSAAHTEGPRLGRSLLLILALALAGVLLLFSGGGERLDNVFYDSILRGTERPANDELVIVAIDEKSLRKLGRWPWPRRIHARLIDKLTASGASAVGIDILFSEQDKSDPQGDALLARAVEENGKVVLAVGPQNQEGSGLISEVLPLPGFAVGAARLAHIDFEMDPDGISRQVFLRAGLGNPHWPTMGLALLEVAHPKFSVAVPEVTGADASVGTGWVREHPIHIAYAGPAGHVRRVSYVDVLEGRVPDEVFYNRIALVGSTAIGLGDTLSTPLSSERTLMPGIEANANVVATLLEGRQISEASVFQCSWITLLLLSFLVLCLSTLPRRFALPAFVLSIVLALTTSAILLIANQLWFPPTTALLLQTVLYIVWSWLDLGQVSRLSVHLSRQLHTDARRDLVTGIPNREQLKERLNEILASGQSVGREVGLLVLSMGKYHSVIDQAGTQGNDELQKQIARRLSRTVPGENMVYRLDGAEFAVLIEEARALSLIESVAAHLVQSLLRPFSLAGNEFVTNPSVGASRFPHDGADAQSLIDNAYTAMHRARKDHSRSFYFYSSQIKADIKKQTSISQGLRGTSWEDELTCVFQPQVSVQTGCLTGVETLVRWHHPKLGSISPAEFIPVAEREGLIVPVGNWILRQACIQGQRWQESQGWDFRIAVNVSAVQLNETNLLDEVREALSLSGLPANRLELELTETALLADHRATLRTLTALKALGVELAIDDFGTGYSSLTYLKSFPMDRIKIDKSFVSDVHASNESAEITRSIVAMTHSLDLRVVAEGVERKEHLDYLRDLGCEEAQGYLLGYPMTPSELKAAIFSGRLRLS